VQLANTDASDDARVFMDIVFIESAQYLFSHSGHIATRMLTRRRSLFPVLGAANRLANETEKRTQPIVPNAASIETTNIDDFVQPASEIFRIYQMWSPEFIGFCPPAMVCIITGPAAIMLRYARRLRKDQNSGKDPLQPSIQEDLLILILSQFATYWNIGLLLLGQSPGKPTSKRKAC
jgi:hypothetical protein